MIPLYEILCLRNVFKNAKSDYFFCFREKLLFNCAWQRAYTQHFPLYSSGCFPPLPNLSLFIFFPTFVWEKELKFAAEEVFFRKWDTSVCVCVCVCVWQLCAKRRGKRRCVECFLSKHGERGGWRLARWSFRRFGGEVV